LSSQLRLSIGPHVPGASQQNTLLLLLTNVSGARCSLEGYPSISLSASSGAVLRFSYRRGGDQRLTSALPTRLWLRPGAVAYLGINKQTCIARQTVIAQRVRVTPPGGQQPIDARLPAYPMLGYCGPGDPGHVVDVTPAEPSIQAVLAWHEWKSSDLYRVTAAGSLATERASAA
jgi:hypothetical protein